MSNHLLSLAEEGPPGGWSVLLTEGQVRALPVVSETVTGREDIPLSDLSVNSPDSLLGPSEGLGVFWNCLAGEFGLFFLY